MKQYPEELRAGCCSLIKTFPLHLKRGVPSSLFIARHTVELDSEPPWVVL